VKPVNRRPRKIGRRQVLRGGLAAAALWWTDRVQAAPRYPTAPAPSAPAEPSAPRPPRPGDPPDKQSQSGVTVRPDDAAITVGMVEYAGVVGPIFGYLAGPKGADVYPGVLVLHDAAGLTEHFKDIARRFAKAGLVALAPDLASRAGGTEKLGDPAKVGAALAGIGSTQLLQDLNASVRYLQARPLVAKTRIGAASFGAGGNILWLILAGNHDVKAAVSVSGTIPPDRVVGTLNAAVLSIYGENDNRRDDEAIAEFDTAMKKAGLAFLLKLEPKAGLDFFNDTTSRYVPDAAKDAWGMTLDWFGKHLTS
jgi:carboxymethylenebutenolidase